MHKLRSRVQGISTGRRERRYRPEQLAEVQKWLSISVNEIFNGLAMSRAIVVFGRDMDRKGPNTVALEVLGVLEQRLADHDWLALDRITVADFACYPYAALIEEGGIPLRPYPAIRAWFRRIEALPGYVGMRGLPYAGCTPTRCARHHGE